ncbi:hypothetical protein O181_008703 [Austropuccinia psidii MF-1]|uniref:Uncharacterized protein n=1 Tax=Austropuccinia psidii MF-1 TaxID=1389203 RepID=A0A9Q3BPY1_9BASI|nr:hypothetical protein [Austropuccinia psidii MF-1]
MIHRNTRVQYTYIVQDAIRRHEKSVLRSLKGHNPSSFVSVEANFIPLENESHVNTPMALTDTDMQRGKVMKHSETLISNKRCTPIVPQRTRKPQSSSSIQGKPTFITCTGKITIINPVLTFKSVQGTVKK